MTGGNAMTKVLVAGDSFASDWHTGNEWWHQLPFDVTNVAQAGASEYKILKSLTNVKQYDAIVVFHTSPTRVYAAKGNLLHTNSSTHRDSCYVINDVLSKRGPLKKAMESYVKYFYNDEFVNYIHTKICNDIVNNTFGIPTVHASGFDYSDIYEFENFVSATDLFETYRGNTCHLTTDGNRYLADRICNKLMSLLA
jgi:hypothetical protein